MTVVELLELVKKMTRSLEDVDVEREATRRGGKNKSKRYRNRKSWDHGD